MRKSMKMIVTTSVATVIACGVANAQGGPGGGGPGGGGSPIPSNLTGAGSGTFGPIAVGALQAKVTATIKRAWDVGEKEQRQLTFKEAVLAPLPAPKPTQAELIYARLAHEYDKLPRRREQFMADVIGDRKPWTYPSPAQMRAELKAAGKYKITVNGAKPKIG